MSEEESSEDLIAIRPIATINVDRKMVAELLEFDRNCRAKVDWPLYSVSEVFRLHQKCNFIPNREELFVSQYTRFDQDGSRIHLKSNIPNIIEALLHYYPLIVNFMNFSSHLVAAGGAVLKACLSLNLDLRRSKDCDFFFYGISIEEAESVISDIAKWWLSEELGPIYRNKFVTTFYHREHKRAYQIIHRVYPSKCAIIGGFDLAPCMILYDGSEILMTPFCLFSLASGLLIPDVSRRSTSFDLRIAKYTNLGFRLLLPCATEDEIIKTVLDSGIEVRDRLIIKIGEHLRLIMLENGKFMVRSSIMRGTYPQGDYDGGTSFCLEEIETANMIYANRGMVDAICWGGFTYEDIFVSPIIPKRDEIKEYFNNMFIDINRISNNSSIGKMVRWFGVGFSRPPWLSIGIDSLLKQSVQNVTKTMKIAESEKGKIRWYGMNDNPGRQHTASFHPVTDTIQWYHRDFRKPLLIGIPVPIAATFLKGWKDKDSILSLLPRDIFRYIMRVIRFTLSEDPMLRFM